MACRELLTGFDAVYQCQVYYIRKATLKTADKRYSSLNNDYEMTFSSETEVSLCDEDDSSLTHIPSVTYNFVPINKLESHAPNSTVGWLIVIIIHCVSKKHPQCFQL